MIYSNGMNSQQQQGQSRYGAGAQGGTRSGTGQISPYRRKYIEIQEERRFEKSLRDEQRNDEKLRDLQVSLSSMQPQPMLSNSIPAGQIQPRAGGVMQRQASREYINDTQDMMVDRRETIRSQDRMEERARQRREAEQEEEQRRQLEEEERRLLREQARIQQQQKEIRLREIQLQQQQQRDMIQQQEDEYSQRPQPMVYQNGPSQSQSRGGYSPTQSRNGNGSSYQPSFGGSPSQTVKPEVLALRRQMTVEMSQMQEEIGEIRHQVLKAQRSNEDLLKQVQRVENDVIPREVDQIHDRLAQQSRTINQINPVSPAVERRIVNKVKNDLTEEFTDRQQDILRDQDLSNRDLISQQQATQKMLKDLSFDLDLKEMKEESRHRSLQRTLGDMERTQNKPLSNAAKNSLQGNNFSIDNNQVYLPSTNNAFYSDVNTTPQGRGSQYPARRTPSSQKQQYNPTSDFSAPRRPATKDLYIEEWANTSINPGSGGNTRKSGSFTGQGGANPLSRSRSGMNDYGSSPQGQNGIPQNLDILDTMVQQSNQRSASRYY